MNPFQIIQMVSNAQDPCAMIQQIFGNHPKYKQIMSIVQGKSPEEIEQYVRNVCKTQNIDVNSLARTFGIQL